MTLDKLQLKLGGSLSTSPDIVLMQDLRLNLSAGEDRWKSFKKSVKLCCESNNLSCRYRLNVNSNKKARGVAIFLNKTIFKEDPRVMYCDEVGNVLIVRTTLDGATLYVGSIYGPNEKNDSFYDKLNREIKNLLISEPGYVILGGDWNTILCDAPLELNYDIIDGKTIPNPSHGFKIRQLMKENNLCDVYRLKVGTRKSYTYKHFSDKRFCKTRLDYLLVSKNLLNGLKDSEYRAEIGIRTTTVFDHRPVTLTISKGKDRKNEPNRGRLVTPNQTTITKELWEIVSAREALRIVTTHLPEILPTTQRAKTLHGLLSEAFTDIIQRIKHAGMYNQDSFSCWKTVLEEQKIRDVIARLREQDWEELWRDQHWSEADPGNVIGDLLIANIMQELRRTHILIVKQERKAIRTLSEAISRLTQQGVGDDDERMYEKIKQLEHLQNNKAKCMLSSAKNYLYYKHERITPEFLMNVGENDDEGRKLAEIRTTFQPHGLGPSHADDIAGIFQTKFAARTDTNRNHHVLLREFLSEAAKEKLASTKLNQDDVQLMEGGITKAELDRAIKSLKLRSAPGPDGTPAIFLIHNWTLIGTPLLKTFNRHLDGSSLPDDYRTARLKLLPKKGDKTDIKNWRPITILNSKYKLLSAVYTNRIKRVVGKLVGRAQKGFSATRRAHEVILSLSGEINNKVRNHEKACAISFDFAAAFDSVDHDYILEVHRMMGFPNRMLNMLKTLINNRNARIVGDDGKLGKPFTIGRGVPQGDLHSPLTFIISIAPLIAKLESTTRRPNTEERVLVEAFADDLSIITDTCTDNLRRIKTIMTDFGEMTGLKLNDKKTVVMPISGSRLDNDFGDLHFSVGKNLRILGHDIDPEGDVKNGCKKHILAKIAMEINRWKPKQLTLKGRLNVAKCFLYSQVNYHGLLADLENAEYDQIEKLIMHYVSGDQNLSKKRAFHPVKDGGLGLPKLTDSLHAQRARMWTLAMQGDDRWREEFCIRVGGNLGWGELDWAGASPTTKVLLKAWTVFRTSFASTGNNFLNIPILSGIFRNSPRGHLLTSMNPGDITIRGGITPLIPFRDLTNGYRHIDCRDRAIINALLRTDLTMEEYRKLESVIKHNIKVFYKPGKDCRSLSAFMMGGTKRGSKKLRKILEDQRKPCTINGLANKIGQKFNINQQESNLDSLIPLWNNNKLSTQLGDFTYRLFNGKLKTNAMLSHFSDTPPCCTFCMLNYWEERRKVRGYGPSLLPKETLLHLFFDCTSIRAIMRTITRTWDWTPKNCFLPTHLTSYHTLNRRLMTCQVLFNIWKCKTNTTHPTRTRLIYDIDLYQVNL